MAEDWIAVANDVAVGIAEVGFAATILRPGPPTGPSHNPVPGAPTPHPCTVLQEDMSKVIRNGTLVQGAEAVYMLSTGGLTIIPDTKDMMQVNGSEYSILMVDPFAPGGETLYYTLQVRR